MKESEGTTKLAESSEEASSAFSGTLGNVKFSLPGDLLLPDSLFGSPVAQVRALVSLNYTVD